MDVLLEFRVAQGFHHRAPQRCLDGDEERGLSAAPDLGVQYSEILTLNVDVGPDWTVAEQNLLPLRRNVRQTHNQMEIGVGWGGNDHEFEYREEYLV